MQVQVPCQPSSIPISWIQNSQYPKECRPYQQDSCQCQDRVWQVWWHSGQGTKHLQHASGNIDELLNRRTTAIERTLRHIELSEGEPALDLLHFQENEEEYED